MSASRGTLAATDITKSFGGETILDGVSLTVPQRARIGIVGPNGVGKSTLLHLLAGLEEPDSGRVVRRPRDLTVRYLAQQRERPGLSGGEAARAALREIFDADDDVLLLDEPTNDLDFDGLALLERFVARTPSAIVVVSHDRAFLERAVTRIVEFEAETRRVREFAGSWADYERAREAERRLHEAAYGQYVDERARFESLLHDRRDQARAGGRMASRRGTQALRSKVRQAERRLERLDRVDKPWAPWRLQLSLETGPRAGDVVARLSGAVVERNGFSLGPVDLEIGWGERIAIVGRNGSGKTTLLRALVGDLPLAAGTRSLGSGVRIGELDQARLLFTTADSLLDRFTTESGLRSEEARTLLAKFGLGADHVNRRADSLSPGERTRAVLALMSARGVNCLVLDEPTNHLDLEAIEELEHAVASFEGTVLLVTHDRRFLEAFRATRTIEL
jgi:ATPase subunit of ABC transporter with duplicated ATPase domains